MAMYLLLSKIQVHNANAMSSPYTVGFPAMTAWLGAAHALERNLHEGGFKEVSFSGVAVVSHTCDVQLYKGPKDYQYSIIGTANPLKKSSKTGAYERPPFIEEARCHLCVSLLIKLQGVDGINKEQVKKEVENNIWRMKLAGGDIEKIGKLEFVPVNEESDDEERRLLRRLMPGYAVIERRDLMLNEEYDKKDALTRLIDMLAVEFEAEKNGDNLSWHGKRRTEGWITPIAVGFKSISGAVTAKHQRSEEYEHRFAEPVVTLGEFRMPYHFRSINEILWEYHTDLEHGLYLCRNQNNSQNA